MYLLDVSNQEMMGVIQQSPPPDPNADFFETLRWQMSAAVRASARFPIHSKLARRAYISPLPFRDSILEKAKKVREEHFQGLVARAQASGNLDPDLDPTVVSFMVQGLMSEMGSFLQSKFGKKNGDWVARPEVSDVFDQVIDVLKHGLTSRSAK